MEKDTTGGARPVVVIDTNVWLDLLVFDDAATRPLGAVIEAGGLDVITSARCRDEWGAIVAQPRWDARGVDRATLNARHAAATRLVEVAAPRAGLREPRCRDPHDQKFVELALRAGARWLVTKDRDLLKLRRAMAGYGCGVVQPQAFLDALASSPLPA